jgi:hypothetical protein
MFLNNKKWVSKYGWMKTKKNTVAKQADSDDVPTSVHTLVLSLTLRASLVVVFLKKSAYKL